MTENLKDNISPRPLTSSEGPLSSTLAQSSTSLSTLFDPLGTSTPTNNGSLTVKPPSRLQKSSPGAGSEALVSSDEEDAPSYLGSRPNGHTLGGGLMPGNLNSRRPSYAAEFASREFNVRQRTFSTTGLNGGGPLSPATSHPATPGASSAAPGETVWPNPTFTWGATASIWKDGPAKKSPPKSINVQASSPLFANSEALPSPTSTLGLAPTEIPIPVPLHPQFRNYRSLSYSAGQPDPEAEGRPRLSPTNLNLPGQGRHHSVLQHRPSRPSLLSEQHDAQSPLRAVSENEDGDIPPHQTSRYEPAPSAYLAQASAAGARQPRLEALRFRNRSASMATPGGGLMGMGMMGESFDESAFLEDDEEVEMFQRRLGAGRSMSVMHAGPSGNLMLERVRGGGWGFESGSRRHSFNVGSEEAEFGNDGRDRFFQPPSPPSSLRPRPSFSSSIGPLDTPHPPFHGAPTHQPSPPPIRHLHPPTLRPHQLLYMVSFKACRTDVFYVQEGTGLRVKTGDLVIVEADRGTDLGTVVAENVSWQAARELKEQYQQEHYKWLMVYARRNVAAPAAPTVVPGSGLGGQGLQGAQGMGAQGQMGQMGQMGQAEGALELKPKMIKRLAQVHEIQTLREKEANEAKAKRLCQQKVLEHRLPMEILDAEFQMDWKKLTFYYFADSYINFNSLVTDLFKVYKTRIWMSAMNPAAFSHTGATTGAPGSAPAIPGAAPTQLGAIGDPVVGVSGGMGGLGGLAGGMGMMAGGGVGETPSYMQHQPMFGALSQAYNQAQAQAQAAVAVAQAQAAQVQAQQQAQQQRGFAGQQHPGVGLQQQIGNEYLVRQAQAQQAQQAQQHAQQAQQAHQQQIQAQQAAQQAQQQAQQQQQQMNLQQQPHNDFSHLPQQQMSQGYQGHYGQMGMAQGLNGVIGGGEEQWLAGAMGGLRLESQ